MIFKKKNTGNLNDDERKEFLSTKSKIEDEIHIIEPQIKVLEKEKRELISKFLILNKKVSKSKNKLDENFLEDFKETTNRKIIFEESVDNVKNKLDSINKELKKITTLSESSFLLSRTLELETFINQIHKDYNDLSNKISNSTDNVNSIINANNKLKNKKRKTVLFSLLLVLFLGIGASYILKPKTIDSAYTIETANLENVLDKSMTKQNAYDLEETIKLLNGIDLARQKSENFDEFYEYLIARDYSKLPNDVIVVQKELLPVINELHLAQSDYDESQDLWNQVSSVGGVVSDDVGNIAVSAISSSGTNPMMIAHAVKGASDAFNELEKQKKLKDESKERLRTIKKSYINYLKNFYPVYFKYFDEWNKICLLRDQAYLEIHNGNIIDASNTLDKVLEKNKLDKEAMLLKSFCLLENHKIQSAQADNLVQVKSILDEYIESYPEYTAPAQVLLGSYYSLINEPNKANSHYDLASVEFPKQSAYLLDMLNSYEQRNYLRDSAEGQYILELYKALMEGYGFFSPNFQKALIASKKGNFEEGKEEIIKHFFRRGNQKVYDYMISDMNYCEKFLPTSFNMIFEEKSFLDLEIGLHSLASKKIDIEIQNRSDKKLSNVRAFLCLHLTDMYKGDYEVFKLNTTLNHLNPHSTADFGTQKIEYTVHGKDKKMKEDIVTARGIIITDDIIAWVDEDKFKYNEIKESYSDESSNNDIDIIENLDSKYSNYGLSGNDIYHKIKNKTRVKVKNTLIGKDELTLKIPRSLSYLNPYFSINALNQDDLVLPTSVQVNGQFINVKFKYNIPENHKINFVISSKDLNMQWDLEFDEELNSNDIIVKPLPV